MFFVKKKCDNQIFYWGWPDGGKKLVKISWQVATWQVATWELPIGNCQLAIGKLQLGKLQPRKMQPKITKTSKMA